MKKVFVIAEAGVNHNGDFILAKELIDIAASSGADAIKFQTFVTKMVMTRSAAKAKYQLNTTLYLVPLLKIQEKIMEQVPEKFWVVFFRRYMMMIANDVAKKINALALITGDSIGQVSSQTLSNIYVVSEASELPIIRPLAGMNKEEIINKAKRVGTYEISIQPYEDCCSYFVPIHPETKSKLFDINRINKKLDLNKLYIETTKNIEIIKLNIGDS